MVDTSEWEFSQNGLDHALSAAIWNPDCSPGLVQPFLSLGAKFNYGDTSDEKKSKSNAPNSSYAVETQDCSRLLLLVEQTLSTLPPIWAH